MKRVGGAGFQPFSGWKPLAVELAMFTGFSFKKVFAVAFALATRPKKCNKFVCNNFVTYFYVTN
jgi:hypothetical protein